MVTYEVTYEVTYVVPTVLFYLLFLVRICALKMIEAVAIKLGDDYQNLIHESGMTSSEIRNDSL